MSSNVGRLVVATLTNKRGSGVNYGDLVYIDTANAGAFTVGTTGAYTGMVGVCIEPNGIANNATGRIQTQGDCPQINLNASGTLGHFVKTYTVAAQATDAGTSRVVGAFGQLLSTGTTPRVLLFGFPDAASSSASAGTPALTLSTTNSAGAASTFVATDATVAVFDSTVPVSQAFADSAAAGAAGVAARRDHKHGMPALGSAGAVYAMGNGAAIWNAGTSFPGSKATNDRYWRTDLGQEAYWDGSRWLTTQLFEVNWVLAAIPQGGAWVTATATSQMGRWAALGTNDLWLVDLRWTYNVASNHDASNYWQAAFHKYDGATDTTVVTLTTDKSTTTWHNPAPTAIGALYGTTMVLAWIQLTKTGTPALLDGAVALRYRIVLT